MKPGDLGTAYESACESKPPVCLWREAMGDRMIHSPKVLFIALDAASKDLIGQWSDEGLLPTFRHLRESARWGATHNAPGIYAGSVWPSIWTGVTPGRHGCYYCEQL